MILLLFVFAARPRTRRFFFVPQLSTLFCYMERATPLFSYMESYARF